MMSHLQSDIDLGLQVRNGTFPSVTRREESAEPARKAATEIAPPAMSPASLHAHCTLSPTSQPPLLSHPPKQKDLSQTQM